MSSQSASDQERACPVCAGNSYEPFADERIDPRQMNEFTYASRKNPEFMCHRLVRCRRCDLVYAPVPPAEKSLTTAYADAAYDSTIEAQAAANSYATALTPYLSRLAGRTSAVEVGAGSGPFLPWLQAWGFNTVIGIEPSRAAIASAPPAVRSMLKEGMFSPSLLGELRPSLLCSFMTLEHIGHPGEFVCQAYRLLEPGGMLAVVVHNWRAPLNRILGLRSPIIDVEHLQLFSPQSLRTLLAENGFDLVDIKPITNAYPLRYWLRLTPFPTLLKKWLNGAFDRIGISGLQLPLRVGNILAVGIKPTEYTP